MGGLDPGTWAAVIAALVAFLTAATRASKAVWAAATALRDAVTSIQANTTETAKLADAFAAHRDEVGKTLGDHGQRIAALESRTSGVPNSETPEVRDSGSPATLAYRPGQGWDRG